MKELTLENKSSWEYQKAQVLSTNRLSEAVGKLTVSKDTDSTILAELLQTNMKPHTFIVQEEK